MTGTLFSAQWYRVAKACPRLRAQVRVQRQQWRRQHWFLLSDSATGRQHRINEAAYQFIGRCDGQRTVDDVWNAVLQAHPDNAPTQDEVLAMLGQLNELELLQSDRTAHTDTLLRRREDQRRKKLRRSMLNPFAFQLPLGDPSQWLVKLDPLAHALFKPIIFWIWLCGLMAAVLMGATEWSALRSHASLHFFNGGGLATAWVVYPIMKALHELGHALAVRRWGGQVHEVGIGLMFLVPAPYVNASAATAFPRRLQRAAVGAAGVMVELTLAAFGLWVWMLTQPGLVHNLAFGVMFIGSVSTLLFNGNPLLRFDAYHVMCDLFDVPNLGARSAAWWGQRLGRFLLSAPIEQPAHARSERKWLWTYAPLSLIYRVALSISLILWLGGQWLLLGFMALVYVLVTLLLQPLLAWSRWAMASTQPGREIARLRLRLAGVAMAGTAALFLIPLPFSTVTQAVVWVPDHAQVRPEIDGFVHKWLVTDGAQVKVGDLLLQLDNPQLVSAREQLVTQLEGLRAQQFEKLLTDANAAHSLSLDIERLQAEVKRAEERVVQLQVRAQVAGTLAIPRQSDSIGAYLKHGQLLGHVLAANELRVRAAVAEPDIHWVQHRLRMAEVRLADAPEKVLRATRSGDIPAATRQLPSAALTDQGGGDYANDPTQKDDTHTLEPVFLVDLTLPGHTLTRVGGRAWVRFDHGTSPLAAQLYHRITQLFLRHFSPTA
jgi:putative peptide zinc metalloprotease protein